MKIELKKYMPIGTARNQMIKVYKYDEVKDLENLIDITPIYEGKVDDAPKEIKEAFYIKVELGHPTIYYI